MDGVTLLGAGSVTAMLLFYAFEDESLWLVLGFAIYNREAECILAHTDGESCLLCSFFTNYLHCRCLW